MIGTVGRATKNSIWSFKNLFNYPRSWFEKVEEKLKHRITQVYIWKKTDKAGDEKGTKDWGLPTEVHAKF